MTWAGMVRNTSRKQYEALLADPRVLGLEDPAYGEATLAYRKACGLAPLHFEPKPADFSGTWVLNEYGSELGRMGAGSAPASLEVSQAGNVLSIKTTRVVEYADNQVTQETVVLDGSESKSVFMNSPRVTRAHLSDAGDEAIFESTVAFMGSNMTSSDSWRLVDGGTRLLIHRTVNSTRGKQDIRMLFDRR
jgi:hypothetical protein